MAVEGELVEFESFCDLLETWARSFATGKALGFDGVEVREKEVVFVDFKLRVLDGLRGGV